MLILASASPRRQELLRQIGCTFRVVPAVTGELQDEAMPPAELVRENARRKAQAVAQEFPEDIVLGADTVVVLDGTVFGKPRDAADAMRMLRALSGRRHEVYTGVALVTGKKVYTDVGITVVEFAVMEEDTIQRYVSTGEPLDKAGAYAVQGRAAAYITRIEGSFSNVVGLPLQLTRSLAEKAGMRLL